MSDRTVIPLTADPASNKAMRDALVEVLGEVDAGNLLGVCVVTVDREEMVTSYKVAERRFTFLGGLLVAIVKLALESAK